MPRQRGNGDVACPRVAGGSCQDGWARTRAAAVVRHPVLRRRVALLALPSFGCAQRAPIRAGESAATDWSGAETMTVTLDEYGFTPTELRLRVGRPVRLRFVNQGGRAHDWTSPDFFRAAAFRPGEEAGAAALAAGGSVDVPAGGAVEVALVPLAPGTHEVDCRRPLHAMLGMTGRVVVTA
jgi:plastocyanin